MAEKTHKSKEKPWYLKVDIWGPCLLILISVGVAIAYVVIASLKTGKMTSLETIMFQLFSLIAGITASFIFGKQSTKQAAKELIKPHVRSAFRRSMSLYKSLSRLAATIKQEKQKEVANNNLVLEKLEAIVIEQINTADDALEDWRDIVPEDVKEITDKVSKARKDNE